jgi:hypothetical protein
MNNDLSFQMVCDTCGCLGIKIENPEQASRETLVYCGDCGTSRGTVGALRDLSVRSEAPAVQDSRRDLKMKSCSQLVALHQELQSLRRKVAMAESRRKS